MVRLGLIRDVVEVTAAVGEIADLVIRSLGA
jgi:hypothetical protein